MPDLRTIKIPKISDGKEFEYLCRDLWKSDSVNDIVQINGRSGQTQCGVDVFGRRTGNGEWFGIQCKSRSTENSITEKTIYEEIEKAKTFNPSLSEYIICTTLDRCVHIQETLRKIHKNLRSEGNLKINFMFWDDIEELLKTPENFNVYYRYYHKYFADNKTLGHAIGKLINLDIGIEGKIDTHYEIMIGNIPHYKESYHNYTNVNYYKNCYFIVNLHEKKMERFHLPCYEFDIEAAFSNYSDRFIISKWINSIKDLDDFIYSDGSDFISYVSTDERREFLKLYHADGNE